MPRPLYIAYRIAEMAISLFSRALHAIFYGGSTHQTLSARSHLEAVILRNPDWQRERAVINAIFFWQADHCAWAWWRSVEEAERTLDLAKPHLAERPSGQP